MGCKSCRHDQSLNIDQIKLNQNEVQLQITIICIFSTGVTPLFFASWISFNSELIYLTAREAEEKKGKHFVLYLAWICFLRIRGVERNSYFSPSAVRQSST